MNHTKDDISNGRRPAISIPGNLLKTEKRTEETGPMKTKSHTINTKTETKFGERELLAELAAQASVISAICELGVLEERHRGKITPATQREAIRAVNKAMRTLKNPLGQ